jgi:hypothetical protein
MKEAVKRWIQSAIGHGWLDHDWMSPQPVKRSSDYRLKEDQSIADDDKIFLVKFTSLFFVFDKNGKLKKVM